MTSFITCNASTEDTIQKELTKIGKIKVGEVWLKNCNTTRQREIMDE